MVRCILLFFALFSVIPLSAQWTPGDVYREYLWMTPADHHEAFLRVGGRYGYTENPGQFPATLQDGDQLILPINIDLKGAIRAEVSLEKVLSHEDSRNLQISVNGHPPISVPEPAEIPEPKTEYMYHTDLTVPIPLDQLKDGEGIRFKLTLDTTQRWNWPQNVFYGLTFRVYYAASKPSPAPAAAPPEINLPQHPLGEVAYLSARTIPGTQHVDYIFIGKDIDWSGRGTQNRKHWQTHRGVPHHTIGRSVNAGNSFSIRWNTEWLPDQPTFGIQARALGADGKYRVSEVLDKLTLADRPYQVGAYAPGPAPRNWVTRSGTFSQSLDIPDSLERATAFQLNWVSWSPCYSNGVFLNGHLLWHRTEGCYVFATHSPVFTGHDVETLQQGTNTISTGLTPLYRGKMVHGMEVQWPGVQVLVRYD